ncbi:hypothetical protein NDU88_000917 [Pleurodeles waltl]|uniref:Uncharacterized protein n=1 Tax=Pleurodeles waltl TaxID=8319 RepID=A0AAV7VW24_PLEWA|nr:hypothetical protein NDU88_000917 [Pleurodeles waltl]
MEPPRPGAPPRTIIARLLNYRDRDCVLRAARDSDKAVFENGNISIYPDDTNKVQNSRKSFLELKAKLRAMNVRNMFLYPVRLKRAAENSDRALRRINGLSAAVIERRTQRMERTECGYKLAGEKRHKTKA